MLPFRFLSSILLHLFLSIASFHASIQAQQPAYRALDINPEEVGVCQGVVTPYGYHCEEHQVITADGYILTMQRIPTGRAGNDRIIGTRRPVLLQHGLTVDGMTWLINSPEQSLAFILADRGFDVWIANTRGTAWSRGHTSLHPALPEFWNWSFDELAAHDFPAIVNFVHNKTAQKMHYVGHSLGTLVPLASFSEGRLADKFRSVAMLCPVAFLNHMTTPIGVALAHTFSAEIARLLGIAEFNPNAPAIINFLKGICRREGINCYDFLSIFTGKNCCLNGSTVATFLKYEPQSTATKTMIHLSQDARSGALAKYDYGNPLENHMHYGSLRPPVYDLTNIAADLPLFVSYGGRDALSDPVDVRRLLDSLRSHRPDKIKVHYVDFYAHVDFIMAVNAKEVVYNPLIAFFDAHQ